MLHLDRGRQSNRQEIQGMGGKRDFSGGTHANMVSAVTGRKEVVQGPGDSDTEI